MNCLNPFWLKLPLGCPDHLVTWLGRWLGWLFSPAATILGVLFILSAVGAIAIHWDRVKVASDVVFSPSNWFWMGLTWFGLKLVHEFAHATACKRNGIEVGQVGLVFVLFAPMAYVDVTASWRLPSKWQRIQIAAAGMYVELLIAAVATFAWLQLDSEPVCYLLYNLMIMASLSTLVFNANPLMRFDGYFILSDLLAIPNLYQEGSKLVGRQTRRFFYGDVSGEPQKLGGPTWLLAVYGWLTTVWRAVVCVSLVVVASTLFHGAGVAIAAVGVVSWYGRPLFEIVGEMRNQYAQCRAAFRRAVCLGSAVAIAVVSLLCWMPAPVRVSVPGIVEFADVVQLRSTTSGFIEEVLVSDGQRVNAGDVLMVLRNDDVSNIYHGLQLEIEQSRLRHRIGLDRHDIAAAQVENRNRLSLEEKLVEARRRFEGLTVRAPISGTAIRRSLDQTLGTYVAEGETLLSVGNQDSKELVVSVAQSDFDTVVPFVGKRVHVRVGSNDRFAATLTRLEPRASSELPHAALAATEGGSLAVRNSTDSGENHPVLTESRFRGVVSIPTDSTDLLFGGQRGTAIVGWRQNGLAEWCYVNVQTWLDKKLRTASR
jgi:putative peptide zinc metalloprotease protein